MSGRFNVITLTISDILLTHGDTCGSLIKIPYIVVFLTAFSDATNAVIICNVFFCDFYFASF